MNPFKNEYSVYWDYLNPAREAGKDRVDIPTDGLCFLAEVLDRYRDAVQEKYSSSLSEMRYLGLMEGESQKFMPGMTRLKWEVVDAFQEAFRDSGLTLGTGLTTVSFTLTTDPEGGGEDGECHFRVGAHGEPDPKKVRAAWNRFQELCEERLADRFLFRATISFYASDKPEEDLGYWLLKAKRAEAEGKRGGGKEEELGGKASEDKVRERWSRGI